MRSPGLTARRPEVPPERLVAELVPPPRFDAERFSTYRPDPAQPSQAAAVGHLERFAGALDGGGSGRRWSLRRRATPTAGGIYLDGGFGVGKTHLLACLWHAAEGPKAFGTFVGFTNLVGALGFAQTVEAFRGHRLLCIDEFELDDPGDTVLMSTLLTRLADAGVSLAATSNTLPGALGEGRFAADDFLREIQALSARFQVVTVDGEDYRHRGLAPSPEPLSDDEVASAGGRCRWRARPLRRPARPPRDGAPQPVRRAAGRRRRRGLAGRAPDLGPERRAAAGRPRRPAVRPGRPGASPAARRSATCSPRS